jgi:hypothetical protein
MTADKDGAEWKTVDANRLMRLVGPSSFKTRLDRLMVETSRFNLGEMTLLVDQSVSQTIDEKAKPHLAYDEPVLSVALPIKEIFKGADGSEFPFTRIVAIDQGEAGIAFAVFNLTEAGNAMALPIATGTVPIRSIRRLIKDVRKFRKSGQGASKFNQRFDSTMFNVRENVAGDVTHAIIGLMKKYSAFPVLENQVEQLESKSKQLPLVYKAVNSRFLYSSIDNHTAIRKNLWFNGERWKVPGYKIQKNEYAEETDSKGQKKKKKTAAVKWEDFTIFPGYGVNAQFTSQTCSHCGRNVGEMLKRAGNDEAYKKVSIDANGRVELFGETIRLYKADPDKRKEYLRRNERNPLKLDYGEATMNFDEFRRLVKSNMRRAPLSLQSKDTTQSQFHCVFENCDNHNTGVHADENAAVNIGRSSSVQAPLLESKLDS